MSDRDGRRYYWLKLHRDFFKRHDTKIIRSMPNGDKYVLFYLALLVESIDHEGKLRFSDTIPYNDSMLSTVTDTDIDIVRSAVKIFCEFGLMEQYDDGTLYMTQVDQMIGSETGWAEKKRKQRDNTSKIGTGGGQCPSLSSESPLEIELEKELELEREEEPAKPVTRGKQKKIRHPTHDVLCGQTRYARLKKQYGAAVVDDYIGRAVRYIEKTGNKPYADYAAAAEDYMRRDGVRPIQDDDYRVVITEGMADEA